MKVNMKNPTKPRHIIDIMNEICPEFYDRMTKLKSTEEAPEQNPLDILEKIKRGVEMRNETDNI
jgi:DNA polymerase II large subunit